LSYPSQVGFHFLLQGIRLSFPLHDNRLILSLLQKMPPLADQLLTCFNQGGNFGRLHPAIGFFPLGSATGGEVSGSVLERRR
jgi:hypothetical protein